MVIEKTFTWILVPIFWKTYYALHQLDATWTGVAVICVGAFLFGHTLHAKLYIHRHFQPLLSSVARTGRKYGIHLIIATQRPDAKTINPQIRANFVNTMAFRVANKTNAKILEAPGAELIPPEAKGMGYLVSGGKARRWQDGAFRRGYWVKKT